MTDWHAPNQQAVGVDPAVTVEPSPQTKPDDRSPLEQPTPENEHDDDEDTDPGRRRRRRS